MTVQLNRKADDAAVKTLRREVSHLSKAVEGFDTGQTALLSQLAHLQATLGTPITQKHAEVAEPELVRHPYSQPDHGMRTSCAISLHVVVLHHLSLMCAVSSWLSCACRQA
jgi:CII-binding regulator of phage lambda lysogenization HflD